MNLKKEENLWLFIIFIIFIINKSYSYERNQLIEAAKNGNYYTVRMLVNRQNVNSIDEYKNSALVYAIKNEDEDIINLLIHYGASLNQMSGYRTPIYCLANYTYNTRIKKIIKENSNYNYNNCIKRTYKKERNKFKNTTNFAEYILNWKVGAVLTAGATAALVGGGGGGGGSSSSNTVLNSDYNKVGADVSETSLNNILNKTYYSGNINVNDYNAIRLAYSLARGYTGKIKNTNNQRVKVAVVDTGTVANHTELPNVNYSYGNQNLAYIYCQNNPNSINCRGTYHSETPNPYDGDNKDSVAWHGTAVASMIGASQNGKIVGVAPDAEIIPYKLSFNNGNFVNTDYLGIAFKNAVDAGATVINNSYGADAVPNYNASILNERNKDRYFPDNYRFMIYMKYAVNEKDAIFVWAAGNESYSQPSIQSGIPLVYKDIFYDNKLETYKNFIVSVAFDTDRNTLAAYSNKCGVAKEYCITAPGTNLKLANPNGGTIVSSGTSFSAPIVSGAIAVLRGAFPYLSGAEITKLIFKTARDLGEIGVDEIYGWGMLDLEKATRPDGVALVPISDNVKNTTTFALDSSTIEVNSLVANSIKKADLKLAFIDDFSRTFTIKLNDIIQSETESLNVSDTIKLAGKRYETKKFFDNALDLYFDTIKLSYTNYTDLDINLFQNDYNIDFYFGNDPYMAFIDNKTNIYNNYSLIKSYDYNSLNPYFRNNSEKNLALNVVFKPQNNLKLNFGLVYQNYSINYSNDYAYSINRKDLGSGFAGILGTTYNYSDLFNTKLELGLINEKGTMLGSKTDGAFNIGDNNITYYASLLNNLRLFNNKIEMFFGGVFGYSVIKENSNSLIKNVSDLYSNAFSLGINFNLKSFYDSIQHNISFLITQPIRIRNGDMDVNLPVNRIGNTYVYENHKINLKSEKKYDMQLAYNFVNKNYSISTGLLFRDYLQNENIVFLKFRNNF